MSAALPIDEILFSRSPGEMRAALVSDGRLVELVVAREGMGSLVGNIYLARIGKRAPGGEAAFVELGAARAGFLAFDDVKHALDAQGAPLAGTRPPNEGEALLVQVGKDAFGQKGPRLTGSIVLPGHRLVLTPSRPGLAVSRRIEAASERARLEAAVAPRLAAGEGAILRTAAEGADATALADEFDALRALWRSILARARDARAPALLHADADPVERVLRDHGGAALRRVLCDSREAKSAAETYLARCLPSVELALHLGPEPLFARHDVEEQIAAALEPAVALPSGGRLVFGTLEALTAIDVDTGRHGVGGRFADAVPAVNLEAAREIARQVRLRNLAGLIVIDFVHMDRPADRARVIEALRAAFAGDPVPVQLGGMTALGLFELTRQRQRESLQDQLLAACDACHGAGRLKSAASVAYEILRAVERAAAATPGRALTVLAAQVVIAALDGEAKQARRALEAQLGRPLALKAVRDFGREQYDIIAD